GLGMLWAELLPDHAMVRKAPVNKGAHGRLGGAVGCCHRVEAALAGLVVHAEHGAEERQDGLAGDSGELVHKGLEVDCRHVRMSSAPLRRFAALRQRLANTPNTYINSIRKYLISMNKQLRSHGCKCNRSPLREGHICRFA